MQNTFFSNVHGTHIEIEHKLRCKPGLNFQRLTFYRVLFLITETRNQ